MQEASLRGQIAATLSIIKIENDVLGLLRRQRELGGVAEADVVAQEAALAQAEQTLPPLQQAVGATARSDGRPDRRFSEPADAGAIRPRLAAAAARLAGQPALATGRAAAGHPRRRSQFARCERPDRRRHRQPPAEHHADRNSRQYGASIDQLFAPGTGFWSAAGGAAQPIFHGGTLLHRELAAKAAYDQAAAQYRSTVIVAFQNVADALRAIQADAIALQKAAASERAAFKSLDIARQRLELGDINYLALLNAQQTYQQALLSLAQARAARFADTVALFQALGGGWWNRSDVEPERPLTITDVLQ